jgi:drug/metabolite transporter (DMT)-like permease
MDGFVLLGLVLALCCSVVGIVGFLLKQRGAAGAPPVEWRHPVRSTGRLFANRVFVAGILVATLGWVFHVGALALAPISLVQATIAGGLVLLTPIADRIFGHRATRREWIGVGVAAAGLALLALTVEGGIDEAYSDYATPTLLLYVGGLTAAAVACCLGVLSDGPRAGVVLGVSGGLLWGGSDVAIKAATPTLGSDGLLVLLTPLAALIAILSLVGLVVSARSLQLGPAVSVIALTSVAANVSTIVAGPVVFGEPLPDDPAALVLRVAAFALIVGGSALTPGPAVEPEPEAQPQPA